MESVHQIVSERSDRIAVSACPMEGIGRDARREASGRVAGQKAGKSGSFQFAAIRRVEADGAKADTASLDGRESIRRSPARGPTAWRSLGVLLPS